MGRILHLSNSHYLKFKACTCESSNNRAEHLASNLVLTLVIDRGVQKLKVMEDSLLIINWLKGISFIHNFMLRPLYEVLILKKLIDNIPFFHIYRERNAKVDALSKLGLHMSPRN